ncbi:Leptomycin B resistance protein [Lachnellula occidentalis]|uniref:Leptomycin B resistance protein n=1 Tax=Lachnellula occidentalis TaxID=215460 RepID=A0A8H8UJG3_9HELO|nr:Leptomycin B resistance protein [Lachnellula occidentalis]
MIPSLNGDGSNPTTLRKMLHSLLPKSGAEKAKGASYFALFRPLQDVQSRLILAAGVILALAAGAPLPIIGVIFSKIINNFPPSEEDVRTRIYELLAVAIAYFAVTWGWAFCWGIVGARISRGLRTQMVHRALGLDQTYYETQCPDITSRLTVDAQTVQSGTAEKVGIFLQSISYFIVAFIVGFVLNAKLTGILFAAVIPSMTIVVYTGTTVLSRFSKESSDSTTEAASIAEGAIKAVQVVQAFDAFETLTNDHENHLKGAMRVGVKKAIAGAVLIGSVFFIAYAANALAFWQGSIIAHSSSDGGAGTVYAIVFLILDASFVIGQAGPFIQSFSAAASAGRRILSLIDYPDIPIDVYSKDGILADQQTLGPGKEITFNNVSFSYPARAVDTILNNINLKIVTGTTVGIVGSSGSGKSTIAALLLRLYDPCQGCIRIDEHTIPEYNLSSLRNQIALVDQDPAVFSGTVYTNIRDGFKGDLLPEEDMRERCVEAAKAADAWTFIESLPYGLETWLGEPGGTKLSGGQKQRLCLARALVGNPSLLVLDEATSALDTISEAAILTSLGKSRSMKHRTTVMIAHRLASVKSADNIIVMGKGHILEQGTHDTLMSIPNGAYRNLIEAQKLAPNSSEEQEVSTPTEVAYIESDKIDSDEKQNETDSVCSGSTLNEPTSFGTIQILRRCLALSRSRLFFTLLALVGCLITGGLILGEAVIFGHLVSLLNGPINSNRVDFYCLMFFVVSLAALVGYITSGSCFGIVSEHLIMRTRDLSLRTILRQDMEWFLQSGRSTSSLVSVISMDSGHLSGLSGVIIGTLVSALVSVIGGAILAHIVAWKIAIVLFATSPIVVLAGFFRLQVLAKSEESNQLAYTEAASLATEACSSIRTIAALGTETATSKRFNLAMDKNREQTFRNTALGNLLLAFALSITYFVYSLAYWWGAKQVRSGEYSSLQFFIVLPAILFSAQAAGQIFSLAPDIGRAKGAASRVFALHDQKPGIDITSHTATATPTPVSQVRGSSSASTGAITFKNVSLTYQSRPNDPIFTNLNLSIKAGETVALVGRSGAGKTSTISLIERFYDPTGGSILLDGIDIKSVPVQQHRARISLVAQDPDLFSGSVAFNVGLGTRPGHVATREEVVQACKAVGIHEFVSGLPDGYETQCGNNGSQLSGGQKQRVAIARAYIRDPEILLLDEATSALDSQSEAQIQEAITAVSRKRTTIMIAHRLTSVQKADRILVFDKGRVVEEGKHEDLMRGGGIYEQMIMAHGLG